MPDEMVMERHGFQAEVARLLDIVAHSLYSDKAVFLRELISNASDACDKLRYLSLTQPALAADDPAFRITLSIDEKARTLVVADNGIGMNHDDLVENLGTIARSGTAAFLDQATGDGKKDLALIGQFGVGFYSAFMVADEVEVLTRRAGEDAGWRWISDGKGEFTIAPAEAAARGTRITLHLKKDADEFLDPARLRHIVAKYSDHIAVPIRLEAEDKSETLNSASALWMRGKSEVTAEQHKEFYHHVAHAFDEPWATVHFRAEGKLEYTALLYVPSAKPFDLFNPERKNCLKLYVKRVFIAEACEELLPGYLRFLKGVVDSEDLPLNISREMLQHNPVLAKIRAGLTKRVLAELKKKAEGDAASYAGFWNNFGAVLKEGLYEDTEQRGALLGLARFRSTAGNADGGDDLVTLADYVGRMKEGQQAIYYITADDLAQARRSPQLEGFAARGIEVLLLTDPVDEFWIPAVAEFEGKPFRSVTRGGADLDQVAKADGESKDAAPQPAGTDALVALLRLELKDAVKDVRTSQRLTDSAVCLVADEGDLDIRLERLLKQHKQIDAGAKRVLEINPAHALIAGLSGRVAAGGNGTELADAAWLLLDQARILQGEPVADPAAFARRLADVMQRSLG